MRIALFSSLLLAGCKGATVIDTDPATVADTDDTDVLPMGCGPALPVILDPTVGNGSSSPGVTETAMLFGMTIQHADGDLAPTINIGVFWDADGDGAIAQDAELFLFQAGAPADAVECETNGLSLMAPITFTQFNANAATPLPFNTSADFQFVVTDASGVAENLIEGNTAVGPVVTACTPMADGSDGTCP